MGPNKANVLFLCVVRQKYIVSFQRVVGRKSKQYVLGGLSVENIFKLVNMAPNKANVLFLCIVVVSYCPFQRVVGGKSKWYVLGGLQGKKSYCRTCMASSSSFLGLAIFNVRGTSSKQRSLPEFSPSVEEKMLSHHSVKTTNNSFSKSSFSQNRGQSLSQSSFCQNIYYKQQFQLAIILSKHKKLTLGLASHHFNDDSV